MMNIQNLAGQVFGQYELQAVLGLGGMGVVYRGVQRNLERTVAVKVLNPSLSDEKGYIDRFYQEAKIAAGLEHAHIGPVYDYGVQGEISYVVMRFLTGGTLADRMKQRDQQSRPLPSLGEISRMLGQLGDALDYAHARGVIHRDIKPSNIMFDEQGSAYLVDFGIAKLLEATSSFTGTNTALGTPAYMPPEQWQSQPLTHAADQYALAITIYHVLTGTLPYEVTTPYAMLHAHLNETPAPIHEKRDDLAPGVTEVLNKALAKKPEDRYESAGAFAAAFRDIVRGQTGELTGFFTTPVVGRSSTRTGIGTGSGSIVRSRPMTGSPFGGGDDDLVTINSTMPVRLKATIVGLVVLLLAVVGVLAYLVLSPSGDKVDLAATVALFNTEESIRETERANENATQVMIVAQTTADARVAETSAAQEQTQAALVLAETQTFETEVAGTQIAFQATATREALDRLQTREAFDAESTQAALNEIATQEALDASATAAFHESATALAQADASATVSARATATAMAINEGMTQTAQSKQSTAIAQAQIREGATAAAATRAYFDATSTAEALTATAEAEKVQVEQTRTAQAILDEQATAQAEATATQQAIDSAKTQQAEDQRATQQVLGRTATADARTAIFIASITATPSPTATLTPSSTPTITPTVTATPTPVPAADPDISLYYDEDEFVLTNVSGETLDLRDLLFALDRDPSIDFPVSIWADMTGSNLAQIKDGECLQLTTDELVPDDNPPPDSVCRSRRGYFQSLARSRYFWLDSEQGGAFSVFRAVYNADNRELVARIPLYSCAVASDEANTCAFELRQMEGCSEFLPSNVVVGDTVTVPEGFFNRVFAEPDDASAALKRLTPGDTARALDGPRCSDGTTWWQVSLGDGTQGWIREGYGNQYWLMPLLDTD